MYIIINKCIHTVQTYIEYSCCIHRLYIHVLFIFIYIYIYIYITCIYASWVIVGIVIASLDDQLANLGMILDFRENEVWYLFDAYVVDITLFLVVSQTIGQQWSNQATTFICHGVSYHLGCCISTAWGAQTFKTHLPFQMQIQNNWMGPLQWQFLGHLKPAPLQCFRLLPQYLDPNLAWQHERNL